jgi:TRAP transporter 4TM/12TM fusion protein
MSEANTPIGTMPSIETGPIVSIRKLIGALCCAAIAIFIIWTTAMGKFPAQVQYGVILLLGLTAVFTLKPVGFLGVKKFGTLDHLITAVFLGLSWFSSLYFLTNYMEIADLREGLPNAADITCYAMGTIAVVEAARRAEGWILVSVVLFGLVYLLFGQYFPGVMYHRPMGLSETLEVSYSYQGIYGVALGSVVDVVYVFVILGVALRVTGAGEFFNYIAMRFTYKLRSGPAQCAIFASAMFGSINGSAPANVSATGVLTIPMMKRSGLKPAFAGGVEASASCVGQIMPPIMGVGAFIMSEITGISYTNIMIAALVPSFLFILSLVCSVAFESRRLQLEPQKVSEDLAFNRLRMAQGIILSASFGTLITLLLMGFSPTFCGLIATLIVLIVACFFPQTRLNLDGLKTWFVDGGKDGLSVMVSCAAIGIIIGAVSTTGLGIKLNQLIIAVGSQDLFLALILAAICSIVLGMGLPTAASYLMVVFVAGPAIMQLGVPELQTHLFVFYYAVLSAITPPVALAIFAAAAISGAGPMAVAGKALKLSAVAFAIPLAWIYHPNINLQDIQGEVIETVAYIITLIIATISVSAALIGYFCNKINFLLRGALLVGAALTITTSTLLIYSGLALLIAILLFDFLKRTKSHA